jgi:two-component system, NtrC family, response regulator AtoC
LRGRAGNVHIGDAACRRFLSQKLPMPRQVLIIDDDADIRDALVGVLARDGTAVRTADGAVRALQSMDPAPDVILLDVRMPGMSGLELLPLLRSRVPAADVVMMTAFDDMQTVVAAMRGGAVDFVRKPLDLHELRRVLEKVFDDRTTRRRARAVETAQKDEPCAAPDALVGRDPAMLEVYKLVGQLADNRVSVLIRGESGTGKELFARAIHFNSTAATQPFVPVNCTALPATLLESELFGHVRGAFTGAAVARQGRFALAGSGTIFLDEIGDTTPEFQAKLLRVLQEREYYPVGADRPERTDARVIAATHRDLEALVGTGAFRSDLYYRLRVVELLLPPLRARRSDVPLLAQHLVRRASENLRRTVPVLSQEALSVLERHPWPGNVRELENCLTRALVLATGNVIRPEHIALSGARARDTPPLATLESVEREHVARVMAATAGHKARAAEILGVSRPRLDRLLARHGIMASDYGPHGIDT